MYYSGVNNIPTYNTKDITMSKTIEMFAAEANITENMYDFAAVLPLLADGVRLNAWDIQSNISELSDWLIVNDEQTIDGITRDMYNAEIRAARNLRKFDAVLIKLIRERMKLGEFNLSL